jgi:hypothetical protein
VSLEFGFGLFAFVNNFPFLDVDDFVAIAYKITKPYRKVHISLINVAVSTLSNQILNGMFCNNHEVFVLFCSYDTKFMQ